MNALVIGLVLLIIALICVIVFSPVGKDRCMKSAKNSKDDSVWCIKTAKPVDDGSCAPDTFRNRRNRRNRRNMLEKFGLRSQQMPGGFNPPSFDILSADLRQLDWQTNHSDHDDSIVVQRFMRAQWPEFSWIDSTGRRVFQKLTSDVSRLGYTNNGLMTHLICPQMGKLTNILGTAQVEVTVTKQRGYIDESKLPQPVDHIINSNAPNAEQEHWANFDIGVEVNIWFPDVFDRSNSNVNSVVREIISLAQSAFGVTFPQSKQTAVKLGSTDAVTGNPYLTLKPGRNPTYEPPDFTLHPEACAVTYLRAIIDTFPKEPSGMDSSDVDGQFRARATYELHKTLFSVFNRMYHNILVGELTWNINLSCPELVNTDAARQEWEQHRTLWQQSMGTPNGTSHKDQSLIYDAQHNPLPDELSSSQNRQVLSEITDLLETLTALRARKTTCYYTGVGCLN